MEETKLLLRDIFNEAAEMADPTKRSAYLDAACNGDNALRGRVERLLAADSHAGNFLRDRGDTTTFGLFPEKIGERIGRYRLIERIGRGGCGVVYLAEQEEPVRRRVALKVIKLGMDTQSFVARFEAERQALAMMDHPNIARVFDAGATEKGRPFFVMELVSGLKITEYCDRHQLSIRQRLELFIPVCHAVQHAHQKGIIHRDLKPSNILVMEHEGAAVAKVIDFGIAKATGEAMEENTGQTTVNQFIGTPAYMSPEQIELGGCDIDTRADIYSLGVVLYELLTGQPPFDLKEIGKLSLEELRRTIRDAEPIRPSARSEQHVKDVRGDLDWIVMKCLEKERIRRYETANGLALDIGRHLENEPVLARPPSAVYRLQKAFRRHRLAFGTAGAIGLVLVCAVFVSTELARRARRAEHEQGRLRGVAESKANESLQRLVRRYVAEGNRLLAQGQPLAALPWLVEALDLERADPQREADERVRIAQAMVGAPELRLNISQGKRINCITLNFGGTEVAIGSDDGTVRVSRVASGDENVMALSLPDGIGAVRFSPGGDRVVAIDMAGRARVWDTINGQPLTPVLHANDSGVNQRVDAPRQLKPAASFSPNGKLFLLAWRSKSAELRETETGKLLREFSHRDQVYHACFSIDGQFVATASKDGKAQVWDVATGQPAGPALQHDGPVSWSQFSSDGQKLLTVRDRHDVQLWDWRDGRRLAPEIPRRSVLYHASLSPNGTNILTTAWSGYAHVYDAASSRLMYEFQQHGGLVDAAFSPGGHSIATACDDRNAWVWSVGEVTAHPLVLPQGNDITQIAYSGDGQRLAVADVGGHARVWELFPAERRVRRLPGHTVEAVEFDRSGTRALILSTGSETGVRVFAVETGQLISTAKFKPGQLIEALFNAEGTRILAFGKGNIAWVLDAGSGRELLALRHSDRLRVAAWSPDGRLVITAAGKAGLQAWDAQTGGVSVVFSNSSTVTDFTINHDGSSLATVNENNTLQLWETTSGRRLGPALQANGRIRDARYSQDGKRLAVVINRSLGDVVELWDAASGKCTIKPLIHRDNVKDLEFSADGRWLATACDDHSARLWDALTGEPASPWLQHDYEVSQVTFAPNGLRLATRTRRGEIRLWSVPTGEPLTAPLIYDRNAGQGAVTFSPDSQSLLLARGGNEAWLRDLRPETASVEELRLRAQVLSCSGFDNSGGLVPLDNAALSHASIKLSSLQAR